MSSVMRIAVHQCNAITADVAANLSRLRATASTAAAAGANLLIVPEMYLTGYAIGVEAARRLAEPAHGPSARVVAEIAATEGIAILYGYPERADADRVFNSVQLVDTAGHRLANYRKHHLFGDQERATFATPQESPAIVDVDGWRVGILICYDVEFPEAVRALALAGAEIVVVPTANMTPYEVVATMVVPTRAFENQLFVAYANYCGSEADLHYCGLSCVCGPDGKDVVRAGGVEELIVCDVEHHQLSASRRTFSYLTDRRPALYGTLSQQSDVPRLA
jgi:predicted amidohydrolase